VLRRLTVTDRVGHRLAAIGTAGEPVEVEAVEIVPGTEGAVLVHPVAGRRSRRAA
jgi:hypothetical protein